MHMCFIGWRNNCFSSSRIRNTNNSSHSIEFNVRKQHETVNLKMWIHNIQCNLKHISYIASHLSLSLIIITYYDILRPLTSDRTRLEVISSWTFMLRSTNQRALNLWCNNKKKRKRRCYKFCHRRFNWVHLDMTFNRFLVRYKWKHNLL